MPDTMHDYFARQGRSSRVRLDPSRKRNNRRLARILIAASVSVVLLIGIVAGAGFLMVNHLVGSIHRISGIAALSAAKPVMPAATKNGMTILLTSSATPPASTSGNGPLGSSQAPGQLSGLIALIHLNPGSKDGSMVSIPATAVVRIPGHGRGRIWRANTLGGPSLLIRTVEQLTNVRIDHYAVLDFAHVNQVVGALGSVRVTVPHTVSSFGKTFPAGVNQLTRASLLPYVRQPGVSQSGRTVLQSQVLRAVLARVATLDSVGDAGTIYQVSHSLSGALSLDSSFSNSQVEAAALHLGYLRGSHGVFATAPTVNGSPKTGGIRPVHLNVKLSNGLWQAIRNDQVASYVGQHPSIRTP